MSAQATVPQHMEALALANSLRIEGAGIRREMNALGGTRSRQRAAEILRDPPTPIAHMRVGHFVCGLPGFGPTRAHRYLRMAGIEPGYWWDRRVGPLEYVGNRRNGKGLTQRQREALADVLEAGP